MTHSAAPALDRVRPIRRAAVPGMYLALAGLMSVIVVAGSRPYFSA
jgi:hypothetical protein